MVMRKSLRPSKDAMKKILEFDPIDVAEKISGKSINENETTESFGIALAFGASQIKKKMLKQNEDLYMGISLVEMQEVLSKMGFERVFWRQFENSGREEVTIEYHFAFWHPTKFLFFTGESYGGNQINGAKVYGYWKGEGRPDHYSGRFQPSNEEVESRKKTFEELRTKYYKKVEFRSRFSEASNECIAEVLSMSTDEVKRIVDGEPKISEYILECDWDYCGMRHYLEHAESIGDFIPWPKNERHLWFIHYVDSRDIDFEDCDSKIAENLDMLPVDVRNEMRHTMHKREA